MPRSGMPPVGLLRRQSFRSSPYFLPILGQLCAWRQRMIVSRFPDTGGFTTAARLVRLDARRQKRAEIRTPGRTSTAR
jgi:hypothetical protein